MEMSLIDTTPADAPKRATSMLKSVNFAFKNAQSFSQGGDEKAELLPFTKLQIG